MIIEILVGIILLVGGFTGGLFVGYNASPKAVTNIEYTYTTQNNDQTTTTDTKQTSMQGQVTLIFNAVGEKTEYININLKDITNMQIDRKSWSNKGVVTNGTNR